MNIIEQHYRDNFQRLVKSLTRPAGTVWDAEDVVQTAYERALRYHSDRVENFNDWFGWVVRNALIDKLNADRGVVYEELDEFEHQVVDTFAYRELHQFIVDMITRENPDHQPILELHFLKGYPAREIYEHNKLSYPNTRKIIQRFRDKISERMPSA